MTRLLLRLVYDHDPQQGTLLRLCRSPRVERRVIARRGGSPVAGTLYCDLVPDGARRASLRPCGIRFDRGAEVSFA